MAESHFLEIFPDVTLLINPATVAESPTVLKKSGIKLEESNACLKVSGTFKEVEDVFQQLHRKNITESECGAPRERSSGYEHASVSMTSSFIAPVEVDSVVMSYINKKCLAELNKIIQSEVRMELDKQQVTFHPLSTDHRAVLAQMARERFITFYQKIATGLQSRSYRLDTNQVKPLLDKFPELLLSTRQKQAGEITLTGRFISLDRFEDFFKSLTKGSSSGQKSSNMDMRATASSQASQNKTMDKEETCSICLEQMAKSRMKTLEKCNHSFCTDCLKRAFDIKPVCPVCGVIYGALKGTQPKGGKIKVTQDSVPLPGYESYGTITIHYIIPDGIQEAEHPNPGQRYHGAVRLAYLPDCTEGQKVLELLKQAFAQRLIFTVGRSSTTGRSNVVTWNDIHHKTSRTGGPTAYGYPDPDYLRRVQEELKVKGIY